MSSVYIFVWYISLCKLRVMFLDVSCLIFRIELDSSHSCIPHNQSTNQIWIVLILQYVQNQTIYQGISSFLTQTIVTLWSYCIVHRVTGVALLEEYARSSHSCAQIILWTNAKTHTLLSWLHAPLLFR
jgi:hypothetical protein